MKWIGAVMVMIASSGIGFLYASEVNKRKSELEEFCRLLQLLLGDIRYMRATLQEAVGKAIRRHHGSFSLFLSELSDSLVKSPGISFAEIWKEAVMKGLSTSSLNAVDKQKVIQFGEMISFAERETIMACFEQYISEVNAEIVEVHNTAASKVKLYRSLGVLTGIFIVVLLV